MPPATAYAVAARTARGLVAASAALLAVGVPADAFGAKATLRPASGPPGTTVVLTGSGFGGTATIDVGSRRVPATARTGGLRATFAVPGRRRGPLRVTARSGSAVVRTMFEVTRLRPAVGVTEIGLSRGPRLRYTSSAQVPGTVVRLRATGLERHARLSAAFADGHAVHLRAGLRGAVRGRLAVPQVRPGPRPIRIRVGGRIVRLPFRVLADPTVAAAGDIACGAASGSATCRQMATSDLLLALRPTAVLALGDTQYELGAYRDFLDFYAPSWGRLKAITYPVVGNHEYGTSDRKGCGFACGYFDYFDGPGAKSGRAGRRNKGYYAFNLGAWRLYALNSNCQRGFRVGCEAGGAQERWLRTDLAAHPRRCSLAFMHHPLFTSDVRPFDHTEIADRIRPLWRAFHRAGGDVILAGHSHFYERFAPQDPQERPDATRGVRQFIVGTGGRNVYGFGSIEPTSRVRGARTFGVLRLALRARSYEWRFVPVPGQTFTDSGATACHGPRARRQR